MSRCAATRRASSRSRGPQQRPPDEALVPLASYRRIDTAATRCPASTNSAAAVAESTPPDKATTMSPSVVTRGRMRYIVTVRKGDSVQLNLTDLDDEGAGVGRLEDLQVHVAGALPGEVVQTRLVHLSPHRPEAWGTLLEVVQRAPERIEPVCPGYGPC